MAADNASAVSSSSVRLVLTTVDVEAEGDLAYESGTFLMADGAGRMVDRGKYVVVWKRVQSRWKLHRDIWNALPAAPK
jgi:ketosteroid isomerase-like protein